MIKTIIFDNLSIDDEYKKDLSSIFKYMKNLDSKLILAINLYSTYILQKRGVIK